MLYNTAKRSGVNCDAKSLGGRLVSLVEVDLELASGNNSATITLTGPANVWFGVGFDATAMANKPSVTPLSHLDYRFFSLSSMQSLLKVSIPILILKFYFYIDAFDFL